MQIADKKVIVFFIFYRFDSHTAASPYVGLLALRASLKDHAYHHRYIMSKRLVFRVLLESIGQLRAEVLFGPPLHTG